NSAQPSGPASTPAEDPPEPLSAARGQLAGWVSDLTLLRELTEQLARTTTLDAALHEMLRAGATLVGARRGLLSLAPGVEGNGHGPEENPGRTLGYGLCRAELGQLET